MMAKRQRWDNVGTPRLFANAWLEALSKARLEVIVALYGSIMVGMIWRAIRSNMLPGGALLAWYGSGCIVWTAVEYLLHRYLFHYQTRHPTMARMVFLLHGMHHAYPEDPQRLVMPPVVSLPIAGGFYLVFWMLFGEPYVWPLYAGFVGGYLSYDVLHYAIHHYPLHRSRVSLRLQRHHLRHHDNSACNFGVSSPLWDYLLGTLSTRTPTST